MFRDGVTLKSLGSQVVVVSPCMVIDHCSHVVYDCHHCCRCSVAAASGAALLLCSLSQGSCRKNPRKSSQKTEKYTKQAFWYLGVVCFSSQTLFCRRTTKKIKLCFAGAPPNSTQCGKLPHVPLPEHKKNIEQYSTLPALQRTFVNQKFGSV